jgi:glutaredoxin-related protein
MATTDMTRKTFPAERVHPAIRDKIATNHADIVEEVEAAIAAHDVVVVGMKQNPFPKRARKTLTAKGVPFHYLEYGSYFSVWRRRNALKMWTGWPTFPMIFVKGTFIGGAEDLARLIESGEFDALLAGSAAAR